MSHPTFEQILQVQFVEIDPSGDVQAHVHECPQCQQAQKRVATFSWEAAIARLSQPSSEQLGRYMQFAKEIQVTSLVSEMWQKVKMTLSLDSRVQAAQMGLRSGNTSQRYRLLFSSDLLDVELMIESDGNRRRLEGEVMVIDGKTIVSPSLVELYGVNSMDELITAESTQQGRFSVPLMTPGRYDMVITPSVGPMVAVEGLLIT
jgi:hypothetical protein